MNINYSKNIRFLKFVFATFSKKHALLTNPLIGNFTNFYYTFSKPIQLFFTGVLLIIAMFPSQLFSQSTTTIFDSAGTFTWTAPAGVSSITVQAWGGGGGGASTGASNGSAGGGGGAFATSVITVVPGTTYTLQVGKGGAKGTGCPIPTSGGDGTNSWFNTSTTLFANAGKGGKAAILGVFGIQVSPGAAGAGGVASTGVGITSYPGGGGSVGGTSIGLGPAGGGGGGSSAGSTAIGVNGDPALAASAQTLGGGGGIAPSGGGYGGQGGGYNNMNGFLNGVDGTAPGGGGGGAGNRSSSSCIGFNTNGGNGAHGRIIIITGVAVFNQTSSWTAPACVTSVIIEAWGGGGAGGGNETAQNGGGGGGGGAYSKSVITVTPGQTYAVTVGNGGVGIAGAAGTAGGDSWFKDATTILAKGGTEGNAPAGAGGLAGLGGLASSGIGTVKYSGGNGGAGNTNVAGFGAGGGSSAGYTANGTVGSDAGTFATSATPAKGGVAPNGGGNGGDGQNTILSGDGQSGFNPGGGGGGSSDIELGSNVAGGVGANGRIILSYSSSDVIIGSNAVAAATVCAGYINVPLHSFSLTGYNSCDLETEISFVTTGTYVASEVVKYSLYYTTTNVFSTTNLLTSTSVSTGIGKHTFTTINRKAGYYWITMDIANIVSDGHTIAVNGTVPANIIASPTPTGLSVASGTQTFKNPPKLTSALTASICSGTSFTYTPTSAVASPTYTWTRATINGITQPGTSNSGNVNELLTNTTSAPINVTYIYKISSPANGCTSVVGENVIVTVNPLPNGSVTGNSICGGSDIGKLTWTSTAGTGPFTITYNPGAVSKSNVLSSTAFTVSPNPIVNTTYTITSVTDANGCKSNSGFTKDTATVKITSAAIAITANPINATTCAGTTTTFSVTASGVYAYIWEVSTNNGSTWSNVTLASGSQPTYTNETTDKLVLNTIIPAHNGYVYRAVLSQSPACFSATKTSTTATLTVNPIPVLNSSTATTTICSGTVFSYTPTSSTSGTTYTWKRSTIVGIKELGTTGGSTINEALTNTTKIPVDVTYKIITSANNCSDTVGEKIIVSITPSAVLNSSLTPFPICSGTAFNYDPSSTTKDTAFTWTRATVSGIEELGISGTDKVINDTLTNITTAPIDVKYVYVTTTTNCNVGGAGDTVVVKVNPNGTLTLTSAFNTDHQSVCVNTPNTAITYTVGGNAVNAKVDGLPPGVIGNYAAGILTISGTPAVSGIYTFSVSSIGTCQQDSVVGTDTVGLSLITPIGSNDQWICLKTALDTIKYAVGGASQGAIVTGLPDGVIGQFAAGVLTISGTPSVSGGFTYTVTTTGSCAASSVTGKINIGLGLISAIGSDSQRVCLNTPIINISYRIVNGDMPPPTVIGQPDGLTGSITSPGIFTIVGTPTVAGLFTYTVTANGSCSNNSWVRGYLTVGVGRVSPIGTDSQIVCQNIPIKPIVYSYIGDSIPDVKGLPGGLTVGASGTNTFTITGTPSVSGGFTYTITSKGTCASPAKVIGKVIVGLGLVSPIKTDSQKVCINTLIDTIKYAFAGGNVSPPSVTVNGLPTGFTTAITSPGLFIITGTPTLAGLISYTITAQGSCGTISKLKGKIIVGIGLTSATGTDTAQSVCNKTKIVNITYDVVGGGSTIAKNLPPGLIGKTTKIGDPAIFTISGTPTVAGTYTYTVTTTGGKCSPTFVEGKIVVKEPTVIPTNVSGSTTQTICANTAIKTVLYAIGGTATGAIISTLPLGLKGTFNDTTKIFKIEGTPNAQLPAKTYNYTVTTTGGVCANNSSIFTLTILNPVAKFTVDTLVGVSPLLVNFSNQSLNSNNYSWNFGDGSESGVENPSNGYIKPGTYTVILTSTQNQFCPDTGSTIIIVKESFFLTLTNVFTPNGDNVNDVFTVLTADLAKLDLEIYSRWGLKMYESHTTSAAWDGRNSKNGMECPDGVYYYVVYAKGNNGKEYTKTGFLNLIR
jgi:gliding motility-associated-like protein